MTDNTTRTDISRLLEKLDLLIGQWQRPSVGTHDTLWTNQDIAAWLQLSLDTVERRVITRPEFPAPLQPCHTGQRAAKRWFAGEVIKWARQHRQHLPVPRAWRTPQSSRPATSEAVAL